MRARKFIETIAGIVIRVVDRAVYLFYFLFKPAGVQLIIKVRQYRLCGAIMLSRELLDTHVCIMMQVVVSAARRAVGQRVGRWNERHLVSDAQHLLFSKTHPTDYQPSQKLQQAARFTHVYKCHYNNFIPNWIRMEFLVFFERNINFMKYCISCQTKMTEYCRLGQEA